MSESQQPYDPVIALRVPPEMRDAIARQAAAEERTISGQVRWLLACAIEARAKQHQTERAA
jgi:hypothetical protein